MILRLLVAAASLILLTGLGAYIRYRYLLGKSVELQATTANFSKTYSIGNSDGQVVRYVALGDSTAAGVGASRLEETYPYQVAASLTDEGSMVDVTNLGISGARLSDLIASQLPGLSALHPTLITVSIGANDATHRTEEAAYIRDLGMLITYLKPYTQQGTVLMANVPQMRLAPAFPPIYRTYLDRRVKWENEQLDRLVKGTGIQVIDLYGRGALDPKKTAGLYAADAFHPSDKGYLIWSDLFGGRVSASD